jgi:hypothetical protein
MLRRSERDSPGADQIRAMHFRRRALLVYGAFALGLVPWTAYLTSSLPARHDTTHWDILWGGFDVFLILAGLATALAILRGSRLLPIFASATGTLLLCDAWFDLLTSRAGSERAWAAAEAVVAEVPLAIFSFWVAHDAGVLEAAAARRRGVVRGASASSRAS